ncbi:hypothetical protein [Mechercharimyces sp. CAU 1602]|uniref:hypothetical protein n=1 Tax=Mechercharimyces sp. CAU 1602 TaxID=2973933 RepID=UPI002163E035|nr:hypothetical protein [Mechercharimyces sp. CAU 1602]MCS1352441.1 hypothetical protein [Mechercharimyces sp. CAU 1602]
MKKLPREIELIVQKYQGNNGAFGFLDLLVEYKGTNYYHIFFKGTNKHMIVDENGRLPWYEDCEPLVRQHRFLVYWNETILQRGLEQAKKHHQRIFSNKAKMLKRMKRKVESKMPEDVCLSMDRYITMAESIAEGRTILAKAVKESRELFLSCVDTNVLTEEKLEIQMENQRIYMEKGYREVMAQLDTYEDRKIVLRFLPWRIPIWRFDLWLILYYIWAMHHLMLAKEARGMEKTVKEDMERFLFGDGKIRRLEVAVKDYWNKLLNPKREQL